MSMADFKIWSLFTVVLNQNLEITQEVHLKDYNCTLLMTSLSFLYKETICVRIKLLAG